jgi:hypothetical protein
MFRPTWPSSGVYDIVDGLAFFLCQRSHYMFRPTWPSSGVYDIVDGLAFFLVDVHTTCFGLHAHLQVCMIYQNKKKQKKKRKTIYNKAARRRQLNLKSLRV